MTPNFLHIGASKCKSSWLYRVCLEHPDIYVPGDGYDNVNFFVNTYHRGMDWYEETFFDGWNGESAIGEFSNSYMPFEPALERISRTLPDVKLTMTLMNPVHRVFYQWAHRNVKPKCTVTLFGERRRVSPLDVQALLNRCGMDPGRGLFEMPDRLLHHHGHGLFRQLAEGCFYAFCLKRVYRYFDQSHVLVLLYDDLLLDQDAFLGRFYDHIGVPHRSSMLKPEAVNPDPPLTEHENWFPFALRRELTDAFRDDIEDLQEMLGRDLSAWLDPKHLPEYATRER